MVFGWGAVRRLPVLMQRERFARAFLVIDRVLVGDADVVGVVRCGRHVDAEYLLLRVAFPVPPNRVQAIQDIGVIMAASVASFLSGVSVDA